MEQIETKFDYYSKNCSALWPLAQCPGILLYAILFNKYISGIFLPWKMTLRLHSAFIWCWRRQHQPNMSQLTTSAIQYAGNLDWIRCERFCTDKDKLSHQAATYQVACLILLF